MLLTVDRERLPQLADAFLEQSASGVGHRAGEYLTPESVRRLIVTLAEPRGEVYNPATGIGQLLVDASREAAAVEAHSDRVHVAGQEVNAGIWAMAQLNFAIHGIDADVAHGDVFIEDRFPNLRADTIMAIPPWNQRLSFDEPRAIRGGYSVNPDQTTATRLGFIGAPGEPIGFCIVKDDELYQLYVSASARGSGAAAALIADAEAQLANKGVETAWLACAIGNERAARFYEKHGWRRTGTMTNHLGNPSRGVPARSLAIRKALTDTRLSAYFTLRRKERLRSAERAAPISVVA